MLEQGRCVLGPWHGPDNCVGHDEDRRSYIVAYAPHDVCSPRVAKCRWRRATTVPRRMFQTAYSAIQEVASATGAATNFRPSPGKFRVEESHDPRHPHQPKVCPMRPHRGEARGNSVMRSQTIDPTDQEIRGWRANRMPCTLPRFTSQAAYSRRPGGSTSRQVARTSAIHRDSAEPTVTYLTRRHGSGIVIAHDGRLLRSHRRLDSPPQTAPRRTQLRVGDNDRRQRLGLTPRGKPAGPRSSSAGPDYSSYPEG